MTSGACCNVPVCAEAEAGRATPLAGRARAPRGGFTFVELLTVIVVIGILTAIALPRLRAAVYAADAAALMEQGRQIMLAGVLALQESGQFPPDGAPGEVPEGLSAYLPAGFSFRYRDVATYTWRSGSTPDGHTAYLYIDYGGNSAIADAMRRHESANALWTETQMVLFASQ